ncbi:hypothetical protein [Mucilaginibacter antarcticus]|uniref:hypothetical protein n=1 Tax=Mucilaginibacter antarcticus TaxID=1855725 RepID=UPI003644B013
MSTITQVFSQDERKPALLSFVSIRNPFFVVISLALVSLLVYQSVFTHQFQIKWDDQWVVFNNYTEDGLAWSNLRDIFTESYKGQYAPLNQLSYTLLYVAAGNNYNPVWFHTFSFIIHTGNIILAFYFVKNLLTHSNSVQPASIYTISYCTAFIMAVHPFVVESVAWMAASKILIYSFFYLLALNSYFKYLQTKNIWWLMVVLTLFILSFGGKEQAVTLPACLLLIDYMANRSFKSTRLWVEKIPFIVLTLIFGYITMLGQKVFGVGVLTVGRSYPFYQNVIFGCYALTEYTVKCLVPVKLNFVYLFPNVVGTPVPLRFWMYPAVIVIALVTLRDMFKNRWVVFTVAFFIIHLAVVLHIIPMSRFSIVADRYAYIASIAVFFLISYYLDKAIRCVKHRNPVIGLFVLYITYLGAYTFERAKLWRDSDVLKRIF